MKPLSPRTSFRGASSHHDKSSETHQIDDHHHLLQTETCSFSQFKIFPGHGKLFIEKQGKQFRFINSKCESLHHQRKRPQKLTWTTMWRTLHKKGASIVSSRKRRTKRVIRTTRNIGSLSVEDIRKKRNEKSSFRSAQRADASRKLKERRRARQAGKRSGGGSRAMKASNRGKR